MAPPIPPRVLDALRRGVAIPALPLALTAARRLDERRQRALCRYYIAAGAGGIAAGVHTTQFAIRDPRHGLFRPVLALVAEEIDRAAAGRPEPLVRIGGICGPTGQAVAEAGILRDLGYHAGLLSLAGSGPDDDARLAHCRAVAEVIPLVGFYLQRAVGGPDLSYRFWRRFAEIEAVVAIKIAPFDRYRTLDVVRAVAEAGRDDIALYTGNDDNIVLDLLTPYRFTVGGRQVERRIVGGLLGHWAVWTRRAVELLDACHAATRQAEGIPARSAASGRRDDRRQRRALRCRQRLRRLHRRHSRGPSPPGAARRHLVPRPRRNAQPRPGRGDRPRLSDLPRAERR